MTNQHDVFRAEENVHFIVQLEGNADDREKLVAAQQEFQQAASRFPGFLSAETKEISEHSDRVIRLVGIYSFTSAETLVRWLESDERRMLIKRFDNKLGRRVLVQYPQSAAGFTAWLHLPVERGHLPSHAPRWKMCLIVLAALYPLVITLGAWIPQWLPRATKPSLQLLTAALAVTAMGFVFVPIIGWMMRSWLATERWTGHITGSILLAGLILVVWLIAH